MDGLWQIVNGDVASPWLWRALVEGALAEVQRFLLVLSRLSGLMLVGPLFGQPSLPMNVRILLIAALALLITPALPRQWERGFAVLDENGDGRLLSDELPPGLLVTVAETTERDERAAGIVTKADASLVEGIDRETYRQPVASPRTLGGLVLVMTGELLLGLLLGLGVFTVLSGLQMAGQIVDQQAGFSLGAVVNPDFDESGSVSGTTLSLIGLTLFLLLEPLGGHLLMLRTLVETFQTLPVGGAFVSLSTVELVNGLVQQSLVLAIRVAAPLVVMMSLVDLTLGFLGHSVPQVNLQVVGFATRASACLLILTVLLTGVGEVVVTFVPTTIEQLGNALRFPTDRWGATP